LLVHIGDPSSNQATTLESQMIHMIQELFEQTLRASECIGIARKSEFGAVRSESDPTPTSSDQNLRRDRPRTSRGRPISRD
jgi:hypothetical protein